MIKNTLNISEQCYKDLYNIKKLLRFFDCQYLTTEETREEKMECFKRFLFEENNFEQILNWLNNRRALNILKKHKVSGELSFKTEKKKYIFSFKDGELLSKK